MDATQALVTLEPMALAITRGTERHVVQLTVASARDLARTLIADLVQLGAWADHPDGEIISYAHRLAFTALGVGAVLQRGRLSGDDESVLLVGLQQNFAMLEKVRAQIELNQQSNANAPTS